MAIATFFPSVEIPRRLRAFVRARETSLVVLAMVVGAMSGVVVLAMSAIVNGLHALFFDLPYGARLSSVSELDPRLAVAVPCLGGLVFGLATEALARWRSGREVDPIEANALHGGRMSMIGSLIVAAQTVWSSGVGASVGLEAGYTQLSSSLASRLGRAFRLRRRDLRTLVGCGAAAGIAAAFGAPLGGAFYGFELVIGSYSVASLAPVGAAAVIGYLVVAQFERPDLGIAASTEVGTPDLLIAALIGVLAAAFGIAMMRGVASCETLFKRLRVPAALRAAIGGLGVGVLAIFSPQVMSSGHGALHLASMLALPLGAIALVFVLKATASVISLGSGFRGGLFFASLLLGALGGQLVCAGLGKVLPGLPLNPQAYAIIGMGALSVSIIGGPLTMTFIALESTGDLWLTAAVLIAVIISAQVTREAFGYSFATWRFHLRGETIRSAADVGWIRDLTAGRMMRRDLQTVPVDTYVSDFREAFPLGSTTQVVAIDEDGRYAGVVVVAEAHAKELDDSLPIREILRHRDDFLLPEMTVQEAVAVFDHAETEALAVVDAPTTRRVIGLLTEAHALRRYTEESELHRRELLVDA
ncbi:MAG TPA: chloride channel protein [Xanthobacteraceae bacterium]|nr:chloride channel protein [Xanthobacteraceae bacterium]